MARQIVFNPISGQFDLIDVAATGAPATPTFVADGSTFTVAADTQVVAAFPITCAGLLRLDGILVMT